ncbi:hypothetical protein F4808DRAFT_436977 [Astrocystis sublimbata]|nr:hypothetical protein F4808DRAFT_436977 [Astrocystis sublimbata]
MQSATPGGPLEDHLRNLILTGPGHEIAPGMSSAARTPLPDHRAPSHVSQVNERPRDAPHSGTAQPATRGGKKRPNQAQRRQMKAEFDIPIDFHAPSEPFSRQYTHSQNHGSPRHFTHSQQQPPFSSHASTSAHPSTSQDRLYSNQAYGNQAYGNQAYGQSRPGYDQPAVPPARQSDWRHQQHHTTDGLFRGVNVIPANAYPTPGGRNAPQPQRHALYSPTSQRQFTVSPEQLAAQSAYLDRLCQRVVSDVEIGLDEIAEKEHFRMRVEAISQDVVARHEWETNGIHTFQPGTVELKCFGSLASVLATKAADMDLGLFSPLSAMPPDSLDSPIPRLIEGALLAAGFGARLLTRTRVPIIKLCEKPDAALLKGLLIARKKWEEGMDQDEHEPDDDLPEDADLPLDNDEPTDSYMKQTKMKSPVPQPLPSMEATAFHGKEHKPTDSNIKQTNMKSPVPQPLPSIKATAFHGEEQISLKQPSGQLLATHYNNAKKLLRRLHGREITQPNSPDFHEAEFILLDKVAKVFVQGLYDTKLKDRILAYPSFSIGDTAQFINHRSLRGVNTMVEGEKLVIAWETTQKSKPHSKTEHPHARVVQQWKDLQHTKNFGINPLWFNKELRIAYENLRQNPLLQLTQLRQEQSESPTQYLGRVNKIANLLSRHPSSDVDIGSQIAQHYVDGIRDAEIRKPVRDLVPRITTGNFRALVKIHKSIHLAAEYKRAISHGSYRASDHDILRQYITILRRDPVSSSQQSADSMYMIPLLKSEAGIFERIRLLPNPSTLQPNKPRDGFNDKLEFPKTGVGVQCDVNFSAHLALQNTTLLRCYSSTDSRVRPLVLFVKHWAKTRGINTPYRGSLGSYGYVLMVLHYLVNVVDPFVCPNLQELAPPNDGSITCQGYDVRFWRDERAIQSLAQQNMLNRNQDNLGYLLQGFFEYYAQGNNMMVTYQRKGFDWGRDVLSLRTHGGLLSKADKGWTGAKTVMQPQSGAASTPTPANVDATKAQSPLSEQPQTPKPKDVKEVRYRYLFAIEDPFELDHNVARTVTHNGIVSIRDEFRRAWRLIKAAGNGATTEDLLEDVQAHAEKQDRREFMTLLDEIHGKQFVDDLLGRVDDLNDHVMSSGLA